jgi:hypothetical protein
VLSKLKIRKPSPALVVSLLALFVALGSSSLAAPVRDAAKKLITGAQIKDGSLTTKDIKNRSLLAGDFKAGQLRAGAPGQKGDPGAPGQNGSDGAQGPSGVLSTHGFTGSIGTITGTGTGIGDWKFAGGTDAVTITSGQRITATAAFAVGAPAGTTVPVNSDICDQPLGGAPTPIGNHLTTAVSTRQVLAATTTFTPAPGFHTIGACVAIESGQMLNNNNITDGWFIVTN